MTDYKKIVPKKGDFKTWDPELSPEIEGVLESVKTEVGNYKSNLYVLRTGDGNPTDVWGAAALDPLMDNVSIGDKIKIIFLGFRKNPKTNRRYKSFDVFLATGDEPPAKQSVRTPARPVREEIQTVNKEPVETNDKEFGEAPF